MGKHHTNTLRRMRLVCNIVQQHYEPGNYAKSYFKVWQLYVYPVYPCCYRTMLNYINTPLGKCGSAPERIGPSANKHTTDL